MSEQSILSRDLTVKELFQSFYLVPDYQREYVWGETTPKGDGGEEVNQFLSDIHGEFENATKDHAPEYFIGTVVVFKNSDDVYELIDGQQRTTTSYICVCAIRDTLKQMGEAVPEEMKSQIASESVDWQGETVPRYRLDLQYEDAKGILQEYADGKAETAPREGTRSIRNLGRAYDTVRDFLRSTFGDDPKEVRRFYGYLTNKVKIIRIETPTVARALKIFETINDRGVGLDAMDLLKNLLFMHASQSEFQKLKSVWKSLTDSIYTSREKPLRFLRYFLLATYNVDGRRREDAIYDWFQENEKLTKHASEPLAFAEKLLSAAKAYSNFSKGLSPCGEVVTGINNTKLLGGQSIKQHFILLLAGRHLNPINFAKLAVEIENTLCVWLVTKTPGKEYERKIVHFAHRLRDVDNDDFDSFVQETLSHERTALRKDFKSSIKELKSWDIRQFRLRYLLAKLTQFFDLAAYGPSEGRCNLADYTAGGNDIEHILPEGGDEAALKEFGEGCDDDEVIQSLGNLMLIEKSINRSISNKPYSQKAPNYNQSKFLITKCQAGKGAAAIGKADKITKTVQDLASFSHWNKDNVVERQKFLAKLSLQVWEISKGN